MNLRKDKFWIIIKENGKLEVVGEPTIFNSRKEAKDAASLIVTDGVGEYNAYVLGVEDILSCRIEAVRTEPQSREIVREAGE
jgi:hypothetical protein